MPKKTLNGEVELLMKYVEDLDVPVQSQAQKKQIMKVVSSLKKKTTPRVKATDHIGASDGLSAAPVEEKLSQFQIPRRVDDEIIKFAGWAPESLHSRVDITNAICKYIKDHDLQKPENKRIVRPDAALKSLLAITTDEITYPQIQKHIERHFLPKA